MYVLPLTFKVTLTFLLIALLLAFKVIVYFLVLTLTLKVFLLAMMLVAALFTTILLVIFFGPYVPSPANEVSASYFPTARLILNLAKPFASLTATISLPPTFKVIVLFATIYFFNDALNTYKKNQNQTNLRFVIATMLVLIATILRLINLFTSNSNLSNIEKLI